MKRLESHGPIFLARPTPGIGLKQYLMITPARGIESSAGRAAAAPDGFRSQGWPATSRANGCLAGTGLTLEG
jgi:hypothetical protein